MFQLAKLHRCLLAITLIDILAHVEKKKMNKKGLKTFLFDWFFFCCYSLLLRAHLFFFFFFLKSKMYFIFINVEQTKKQVLNISIIIQQVYVNAEIANNKGVECRQKKVSSFFKSVSLQLFNDFFEASLFSC